jgi:hypothetical protein
MKMKHMVLPALILALAGIIGCGIEAQESSYKYRLKTLDALAQKVDGDLKLAIAAEKQRIETAYAALPAEEEKRGEELGKINSSSYRFIGDMEKKIEALEKTKKAAGDAAAKAAFDAKLALMAGKWSGLGMQLLITNDGTVQYERLKNGGKTSITGGKVVKISNDSFEVKVLVASTTFRLDVPPAQKNGVWTMTVDGVELKKQ